MEFWIFFYHFFPKTGFDISCKLSPNWENKKNIINLSFVRFAQKVVKLQNLDTFHLVYKCWTMH